VGDRGLVGVLGLLGDRGLVGVLGLLGDRVNDFWGDFFGGVLGDVLGLRRLGLLLVGAGGGLYINSNTEYNLKITSTFY